MPIKGSSVPSAKKLYIDREGVERGYYVYVHKDNRTGEVFYVGKGHGRRAWDARGRHKVWQEKVASLEDGWSVEILKDNLSEFEAFELEHDNVIEYGGSTFTRGKLTNRVSGGADPLAITISIETPDFGWSEAYCAARQFRFLPRQDQEKFVKDFLAEIDVIETSLDKLCDEGSDNEDDLLLESAEEVEMLVNGVTKDGKDFLKRKISWKDLCLSIEDASDDLADEASKMDTRHARVRPLLKIAAGKMGNLVQAIDSGNRDEAEAYAWRIATENAKLRKG